jgi:hypothetical protein
VCRTCSPPFLDLLEVVQDQQDAPPFQRSRDRFQRRLLARAFEVQGGRNGVRHFLGARDARQSDPHYAF